MLGAVLGGAQHRCGDVTCGGRGVADRRFHRATRAVVWHPVPVGPEPHRTPVYQQIADAIGGRILSGELAAGDPIPSLTEIQRDWNVSLPTAQQTLKTLREAGLVAVRPGLPTVAVSPRTVPAPAVVAEALGVAEGDPVRLLTEDRSVTFYRVD